MRIRERFKTMIRVLRLSKKPDRSDFMLSLKIFIIGLLLIGAIAFTIHLIASLFQLPFLRGG
ncbi:MAG: protein translocase SEC61 complex subunit gamma [Thermoproteota archaeon]